ADSDELPAILRRNRANDPIRRVVTVDPDAPRPSEGGGLRGDGPVRDGLHAHPPSAADRASEWRRGPSAAPASDANEDQPRRPAYGGRYSEGRGRMETRGERP